MTTELTKAAQQALEALDSLLDVAMVPMTCEGLCSADSTERWEEFSARRDALRAALQDKAGEVAVAIDHLYNERRDDMTSHIFPPVKIGTKLFAAQPAPVVPDGFALVPVSLLIEAEESVDDYLSGIGSGSHDRRVRENLQAAIAASQQKGGSAG